MFRMIETGMSLGEKAMTLIFRTLHLLLYFLPCYFQFSIKAYHMLYNNCHQSGVS